MPPKTFYEINKTSYLFGKTETPEEKVRQWTIFELLSTYGFNINDIQVEVPCKIGSKYFPADIVIYKDRTPLISIECKRQEDGNQEEALKQAESYANFLKANFLVFTNGQSWIVKRNSEGIWNIISDIPSNQVISFPKTITDDLRFIERVKPILYWTYLTIPKDSAYKFFERLLYFFQGEIRTREIIHEMHVSSKLLYSLEHILCVIGAGNIESVGFFDEDGYKLEKMKEAVSSFEGYLDNIGFQLLFRHKNFEGYRFKELLGMLSDVNDLIKNQQGIFNNETLFLRLMSTLIEYLWQIYKERAYIEIPVVVMREVEKLINEVLSFKIGSRLPDSLDVEDCRIMRSYSSEEWEAN